MLWFLLACAPKAVPPPRVVEVEPGLREERVSDGVLASRVSDWPADLVLFYAGEQLGSLDTCGCPRSPKGSLARLGSYLDAAHQGEAELRVLTGAFLSDLTNADTTLRGDVPLMNRWAVEGLGKLGWDAVNVSTTDLVGLAELGPVTLPLVSANIHGPGLAPWVVVERGGRRVGVTGIAAEGLSFTIPEGYTVDPPQSVGPLLAQLAAQVDVLVLVEVGTPEAARVLRHEVPDIDVIVDVGQHRDALEPARIQSTLWVYSPYQTWRAGELRVRLADGHVTEALDRKIDLDETVPSRPDLQHIQDQARAELDTLQARLFP